MIRDGEQRRGKRKRWGRSEMDKQGQKGLGSGEGRDEGEGNAKECETTR